MANYEEARGKLTNTQLNKLKSAAKNKTGTALRISKKKFQDGELPRELFLTTRQTTKIRNTLTNNMSMDMKLSKPQFSKIIQPVGFLSKMIGNRISKTVASLGRKVLLRFGVPLVKDISSHLAAKATSSVIDCFEIKNK